MQATDSLLQKSADILLDDKAYPGELRSAAHDMREALGTLAGFDDHAPTRTWYPWRFRQYRRVSYGRGAFASGKCRHPLIRGRLDLPRSKLKAKGGA
jgi:hypothetical protein